MDTGMYSRRRWVGWLAVFSMVAVLAAKAAGFLPEAEAAAAEPGVILALAPLTECGQPDQVGAFRAGEAPCHPALTWNLMDLARQLTPLNVLAKGETLVAPPTPMEARCPFLVMRGKVATGAQVCFTARGGLYRNSGGALDAQWSWRVTPAGQWVLDRTGAPEYLDPDSRRPSPNFRKAKWL